MYPLLAEFPEHQLFRRIVTHALPDIGDYFAAMDFWEGYPGHLTAVRRFLESLTLNPFVGAEAWLGFAGPHNQSVTLDKPTQGPNIGPNDALFSPRSALDEGVYYVMLLFRHAQSPDDLGRGQCAWGWYSLATLSNRVVVGEYALTIMFFHLEGWLGEELERRGLDSSALRESGNVCRRICAESKIDHLVNWNGWPPQRLPVGLGETDRRVIIECQRVLERFRNQLRAELHQPPISKLSQVLNQFATWASNTPPGNQATAAPSDPQVAGPQKPATGDGGAIYIKAGDGGPGGDGGPVIITAVNAPIVIKAGDGGAVTMRPDVTAPSPTAPSDPQAADEQSTYGNQCLSGNANKRCSRRLLSDPRRSRQPALSVPSLAGSTTGPGSAV